MKTTASDRLVTFVRRHKTNRLVVRRTSLGAIMFFLAAVGSPADPPAPKVPRTWPQAYSVLRDEAAGILTLRTPYYTVEQDLKKGGAITRIALTHGKAANLLVHPMETRVRDESGTVLTDLQDSAPTVTHRREGLNEIVTVECVLKDQAGRASELRVKTTFQYRWGYIKIRKEFLAPAGNRVREVCPLSTVLAPSLSDYGYREGITEEEKDPPFSFGSNRWGKLRLGPSLGPGPPDALCAAFHDLCRSRSRGPGVVRGIRSLAMGTATDRTPRWGPVPARSQSGPARVGAIDLSALEPRQSGVVAECLRL